MSSASQRRNRRHAQTADQIFRRLLEGILSGEFQSGTALREARMARAWNVSRTPLREAVRRAAAAGFIVLRPNQAPIIRPLSAEDIRHLYELREVLELYALDKAWSRFSREDLDSLGKLAVRAKPGIARDWPQRCLEFDLALHGCWMRRSANSWLIADLERHYQFLRIFQGWIGRDHRALAKAHREHVAILKAIKNGDQTHAEDLLRKHIRDSAEMVQQALPTET